MPLESRILRSLTPYAICPNLSSISILSTPFTTLSLSIAIRTVPSGNCSNCFGVMSQITFSFIFSCFRFFKHVFVVSLIISQLYKSISSLISLRLVLIGIKFCMNILLFSIPIEMITKEKPSIHLTLLYKGSLSWTGLKLPLQK